MRFFAFLSCAFVAAACGGSIATIDAGPGDGGVIQDSSSSQDGTTGKGCGSSSDCPSTSYCDFNGHCEFAALKKGTCKARPQGCPEIYSPTCACDGKVYSNECEAHGNGVDVNVEGGCPAPSPEWISCGKGFCTSFSAYCEATPNDAIDPNDPIKVYHQCKSLPPACQGKTTCACFPSGSLCGGAGQCSYQNGFTVTCPGG